MIDPHDLGIDIYCDGVSTADHLRELLKRYPYLRGFTTNPTLMFNAGVKNYEAWAKELLATTDLPISFEVIADDLSSMERQARLLHTWGPNVFVKIPITTTRGQPTLRVVKQLAYVGVKINLTAVMTVEQIHAAALTLSASPTPAILSVFAGRIADTGRNPEGYIQEAVQTVPDHVGVLWASVREPYNVMQAINCGARIITVAPAILDKLAPFGKSLAQHSLDTVTMFYTDAVKAGYTL